MFRFHHDRSPGWAALLAVSAALILGGVPALGQGNAPTARHIAPAAAIAGQHTPVTTEFTLPSGYSLVGFPKLRVTDARGKLRELLPTYITRRPPAGQGHRTLHSANYRSGVYLVRLEVTYRDRAGRTGTVQSPPSPLTVPGR